MNQILVKKNSGNLELYSIEKLRRSLSFTGANDEQVSRVLKEIEDKIFDGISTQSLHKIAFGQLRKISRSLSAYYGTKKALTELGPDGYLFEKYIARAFQEMGYETEVGVVLEGKCISHEVDVVATKDNERVLVECKFHNTHDKANDVKTALYIQARYIDLKEGSFGNQFNDFWLVSNTTFSEDAKQYGTCVGLHLWGANFPPQNTLQDFIKDYALHPVTSISSLKKTEKAMLLDSEILLAKDIQENPNLLLDIGIDEKRIKQILREIVKIQNRGKRIKK